MNDPKKKLDRVDLLIASTLAIAYVVLLVLTASSQGYARDEGFYFRAAESYAKWLEMLVTHPSAAMLRSNVDASFSVNHEHPALAKSLFAISWMVLYKKLHLFAEEGTSFRFAGMCFAGVALSTIYAWGRQVYSRLVGVGAALLFALVPTTFYHAHLDCFDVPITTMWLLTAYCYWRSATSGGTTWAVVTGIVYGLTLDTKHNSWFLPIAVLAHAIATRDQALEEDLKIGWLRIPLAFIAMSMIGPVIFVLMWPWLWFDTLARFREYAAFHLNHDYYNIELFGVTYWRPPFPHSWSWVMTAATVPTVTLVLFLIGIVLTTRRQLLPELGSMVPKLSPLTRRLESFAHKITTGQSAEQQAIFERPAVRSAEALWLIGVGVNYGPWVSSGTPIFGGTKHWMTAYPFVMLFAAVGLGWVVETLQKWLETTQFSSRAKTLAWAAVGAVIAAPMVETLHAHPWGLTGYVPLVGGAVGAANLGLNRSFWGYTTGSVIDVLNQNVRRGGAVYVHDTAWESWRMLQRDGRLRGDIRGVGSPGGADAALYHHEQHMAGVEYQIWVALNTTTPAAVRGLDGVPIVWVYLRDGRANSEPR
ncbi:MAG: glycosyltransferase family 39 protein [Polyangiaceae bacterium]